MTDAKRLLAEATPLPWYEDTGKIGHSDYGLGEMDEPEDAALIVYAVNHLPDYLAAVSALERLYFRMGGNRDKDHTSCTAEECEWRQAKDALQSVGRSVVVA